MCHVSASREAAFLPAAVKIKCFSLNQYGRPTDINRCAVVNRSSIENVSREFRLSLHDEVPLF